MSNFTPTWFKKGFFNESLFCDDFLSTHQLLYVNGAFFTPDGRMTGIMPLRSEIFEMMREYVGANLAKKVSNVVDLKDNHPVRYTVLLLSGKLNGCLVEIDQQAKKQLELIVQQMAEREKVTEELKAIDQMEWVRRMNSIQNRAEEVIKNELIFV